MLVLVVVVAGGVASVGTSPGRGSLSQHVAARRSSAKAVVRRVAPFTAPRVAPLVHPALQGEGIWHPASYRVTGSPAVLVTTFRTGAGATVYAALMDHTRSQLALYPGLSEPPLASPRGSAEVPHGQRWRLLATFNGGFEHDSGAGGFVVNGRVDEPLQTGLGTVVEYRNGRVDVVGWHRQAPVRALVFARQNLPLLVNSGRVNPTAGELWRWGVTIGRYAQVWRTAVGIDRHGDIVYAAADGQTAASLAAVMVHLGAVRAVQLDINPEWPSFIAYGHRGGGARTSSSRTTGRAPSGTSSPTTGTSSPCTRAPAADRSCRSADAGSPSRNDALDGLRLLAVAAVMAFHFGLPDAAAGFLGVDVFFVLSGFLITSLLLARIGRRPDRRLRLLDPPAAPAAPGPARA